MTEYEQVIEKFKKQNIDINGKHILINNNILDGKEIFKATFSKDKRAVCIPIEDEEESDFYGEPVYRPKCFFIEEMYSCWIKYGSLSVNSDVYILSD